MPVIFIVVETRYRYPSYAFFAIFAGLGVVEVIKYAGSYSAENAKRFLIIFLVLSGNSIFDIVKNWDRIVSRLPGSF